MADEDEGQEKTEQPTERRLREAIEQGQILTSKEMLMSAVLIMGTLQFIFAGRYFFLELMGSFREGLTINDALTREVSLLNVLGDRFGNIIIPLITFFTPLLAVIFIAQRVLGGVHFMPSNLEFKLSRLSPLNGLQRMFSMRSLFELIKSLSKIILVGSLGFAYIYNKLPVILGLSSMPFDEALTTTGQLFIYTLAILVAGACLIAALDTFYQWRTHTNQLMMTRQEMKDEYKQTEGSPEVKRKIRQMQRDSADRGSVANIKDAQVVITNPQHYAVALRYDFEEGTAPKVVAKGADAIAAILREQAQTAAIPILSYPLLARALYYTSEIGGEIHSELYRAVAAILTFVYQANLSAEPPDVDVPEALHFDTNGRLMGDRT
jgi:flagellar biosynthetic protein FlhB